MATYSGNKNVLQNFMYLQTLQLVDMPQW
jgi:hypothetical protein